jgi:hypothetical protein
MMLERPAVVRSRHESSNTLEEEPITMHVRTLRRSRPAVAALALLTLLAGTAAAQAPAAPTPSTEQQAAAMPDLTGTAVAQTPATPTPATEAKPAPAPEPPKGPNTGNVSFSGGVDVPTAYFFRGIRQSDGGWIFQPYAELGFKLYEGSETFGNLAVALGSWNSLQGGPVGVKSPDASEPKAWYESDFYFRVSAKFFENFTGQILYTAYMSPDNLFNTVQEIAFGLSYDDSKLLGPFALNPSVLFAKEVQGQADAGAHKGMYLQLGVTPGYTFDPKSTYPITFTVPFLLGLSVKDYYEFGTGDNPTFGYTNLGLAVSVPLAFIPPSFGTWTAKASMNWLYLGETLKTVNNGDRNQIIGTLGIAFSY